MATVSQQYLKDKDGEMFSPITSSDSVYLKTAAGGAPVAN